MYRRALVALIAIPACLISAAVASSQVLTHRNETTNPIVVAARDWAVSHHMPLHPPARFPTHPPARHIPRADGGIIGPVMTTVTAAELQTGGIVLSAPYTDSPSVTAAQADATATASEGDSTPWVVRETVLADYTGGDPPGTVDRLTWVVSLMEPDGSIPNEFVGVKAQRGQLSSSTQHTPDPKYLIVLVDANTGQVIFSQEATD